MEFGLEKAKLKGTPPDTDSDVVPERAGGRGKDGDWAGGPDNLDAMTEEGTEARWAALYNFFVRGSIDDSMGGAGQGGVCRTP